jgi:hypothetical protein
MSYVGYSGVTNLALTHPGLAAGASASTFTGGSVGAGVGGETTIWLGDGGVLQDGFILLEISGTGDPLDYVLEENTNLIKLEIY